LRAKRSIYEVARKREGYQLVGMTRGVVFQFNCQTARGCASAISRRDAPELCVSWPPSETRGRREDRVRAAPAVPCALLLGKTHTSIQVQRRQSGLPCAVVDRLIARSPRCPGFLATVIRRSFVPTAAVKRARSRLRFHGCDHAALAGFDTARRDHDPPRWMDRRSGPHSFGRCGADRDGYAAARRRNCRCYPQAHVACPRCANSGHSCKPTKRCSDCA
jgi:hypothetical protein